MTPLDLARAFLEKGREDEALLERIVADAGIADALFGFHAQQAVEKYLKAVLATEQERPQRTHDLGVLAEQCAEAGHILSESLRGVVELSQYAVRERYPMALVPPIDRAATLEVVVQTRRWAEEAVRSGSW